MTKISAKIVADSINPQGNRLTSYILTYPRSIHAELMTHRVFSRNAASSRAIPFKTMLSNVREDPFTPIAWQRDHSGMQGTQYFTSEAEIGLLEKMWEDMGLLAAENANYLHDHGVTKQICNRLLEPFLWYTVLVTATEYDNWFDLRAPKYPHAACTFKSKKDWNELNNSIEGGGMDVPAEELDWIMSSESGAEIHIQALAEAMWDALNESTPKELKAGQWHIPFGDRIDPAMMDDAGLSQTGETIEFQMAKIAVARCARLSYMTFDGEIDYRKDIALHDMLLENKHMSPFEHCAVAMTQDEYWKFTRTMPGNGGQTITEGGWCNNIRGFIQYRYLVEK